jgi:hypothetical protein
MASASAALLSLQERAASIASEAKTAAAGYYKTLWARASKVTGAVQSLTMNVTERISANLSSALAVASDAKAAALVRVASARDLVASSCTSFQEKGLRPWVAEAVQATREELGSKALKLKVKAGDAYTETSRKVKAGTEHTRSKAVKAAEHTKASAKELSAAASQIASEKSVQTSAACAAGGAVTLGVGGSVAGVAAGGVLGAAAGLPLSFLTFGLSVPIGASIGSGAGLAVGAVAGAVAGAVGGGAAGYGAYAKRDEISGAASKVATQATDGAEYVKGAAHKSVDFVKGVASSTRARFLSGGTGSTD